MKPYTPSYDSGPDVTARLTELQLHSGQTKALLSALGDYWTAYYRDTDVLAHATTGYAVALSAEYRKLLNNVLAANIIDVPIQSTLQVDLLVFSETDVKYGVTDSGESYLYFDDTQIQDIDFLTASLFESEIILENGVHFTVDDFGTIKFSIDIFNDPLITGSAYRFDEFPNRKVLFWGTNIALSSTLIYERYGRFLYRKAVDSEQYKWLITALLYFYTNTKSVKNIENVLNILYGVPFAAFDGEIVKSIYLVDKDLNRISIKNDESFYCIETDKRTYYTYAYSDIIVNVGDTLSRFQLLAKFHTVDDYITDPSWCETARFPTELLTTNPNAVNGILRRALLTNVLKYNIIYVNLKVSYQTYATYLNQLSEIKKIIKSGLPVYLYPLIGTVFKASFEDKLIFLDQFDMPRMHIQMTSQHQYSHYRVYDGKYFFYGYPDKYHTGPESERTLVYDGELTYSTSQNGSSFHRPFFEGISQYYGNTNYDAQYTLFHDSEQELFSVNQFSTRLVDTFDYSDNESLRYSTLFYSGEINHSTTYIFGMNNIKNIELKTDIHISNEDSIPAYQDTFSLAQIKRPDTAQ